MTNDEFREYIENEESELIESVDCENKEEIINAYRKLVSRIIEKVDELDNPEIMLLDLLTKTVSDLQEQKELIEVIANVILYIFGKGNYCELHTQNITLKVEDGKLKANDVDFLELAQGQTNE